MKRWIGTIVLSFIKWFFGKNLQACAGVIKEFYQLIRRGQFTLHEIKEVNVKKGKCRYTLLFIETRDGNVRLNMGRHGRDKIEAELS